MTLNRHVIFFYFSIDLAVLSNNLLKKIFQTPTAFIFLQEYETLSKDYENEILKNSKSNDEESNNIDYFIECIKPFFIKKPKVKKKHF